MTYNPFTIKPKNRKILKSSKVRAWFKQAEERVKEDMKKKGLAWWDKPNG